MDSQECLARNSSIFQGNKLGPLTPSCLGGCEYALTGGSVCVDRECSGRYEYTGNGCNGKPDDGPPDDAEDKGPDQSCKPAGDGQTFCLKPNGDHCHSASAGRQICWQPGETGEKNDGNTRQKRNAGDTPIPPTNLQLPSGDSLTQNGSPITTTTTTNTTTNTTNITTTTTNYTTTNGTNANGGGSTGSKQGENSDGSKGEGDGKGTATGGTDCKTPPIVTGDQVLGMVATQTWHARCATEAGNAAKVTGDVGDCSKPFSVEGNNANAVKLRAMRAQICKGDENGNGQPDWTEGDGDYEGDASDNGGNDPSSLIELGIDLLDQSGFGGGGSCPQFGTLDFGPFGSFSLDGEPMWCQLVSILAVVIPLFGAFTAIRILME